MTDLHSITDDLIADNLTDPVVHIPFAAESDDEMDRLREIVKDYDVDYEIEDEYPSAVIGVVIIDLQE